MVLSPAGGGPGSLAGTPPSPPLPARGGHATRRPAPRDAPRGRTPGSLTPRCERGSQSLEFAMVLPLVALALALVLCTGLVGMEMVHAQGVAREAARAAALGGDTEAAEVARAAAGGREVTVRLDPPHGSRARGDLVTAEVAMSSVVLARLGVSADLRATATMRVEGL